MHGVTLGKELMGRLAMYQDCQEHYHGTTNYTVMQTCLNTNDKRNTNHFLNNELGIKTKMTIYTTSNCELYTLAVANNGKIQVCKVI